MSIPITNTTPRIQYTITGAGDLVHTIPFAFFANGDIVAYKRTAGAAVVDTTDLLVNGTAYTLTGAGNENGGTLTLTSAPATGDILTILRDMNESRASVYGNDLAFNDNNLNNDFSYDVMMNQQNEMRIADLSPHYQSEQVTASGDLWLQQLPAGYSWRKAADRSPR